LHGQHASSFVGVCFSGDEPETLRREATRLASFESGALNFADYTDLPIEVIAALLSRCRYFVGGDNGIKHLAWALDIPRTFFVKERPPRLDVLRWMPDVHRLLTFDCGEHRLRRHLVGNGKARED
jgi:ADP-heptose:LPS heptosyltransferase